MTLKLQKSLEGMLAYLEGLQDFFSAEIPLSKLVQMFGRERPGGIAAINLTPHDARFQTITIWQDMRNLQKVKSIAFHCPDYPLPLEKVTQMFGDFTLEFVEDRKYTLFICNSFPEESPVKDFSFVLKGLKIHEDDKGVLNVTSATEEDAPVEQVARDQIWFDNFVFYLKDGDAVPDEKRRKSTGFDGMINSAANSDKPKE